MRPDRKPESRSDRR